MAKTTLPLTDADHAALVRLAASAGTTAAGWLRGAVRAADQHAPTARRVAGAADPELRGGARPGAGRPRVRPLAS